MPEFRYGKGRIIESISYITEEIKEFDAEYAAKTWKDYRDDKKLQKLIDRTVENILTALIEVCGAVLTGRGVGVESYSEALAGAGRLFGFSETEQEDLSRLAVQRNRLAHRYLNFRWQAVRMFAEQRPLVVKLLDRVLAEEIK